MEDVKGKEIIDDAPIDNKVSDEMESEVIFLNCFFYCLEFSY
jgi:hypothetical protein